jgi:hypothetical protein
MPRKTRAPISPSPRRRTRQRCDGFLPARSRPRRTQSFDCASFRCPKPRAAVGHGTVCLAATRGSRRRMRLTDFCFPTTRLRALASRRFPGWSPGFRPTPPRGTVRFTTRRSASVDPARSDGERSLFSHRPKDRTSDTPFASPAGARCAFAPRAFRGPPDRFHRPPVKANDFHDPRCLPSPSDPALVSGRVSVAGALGVAVPRSRGFAATSRFSTLFRAQLPPPVREASPAS